MKVKVRDLKVGMIVEVPVLGELEVEGTKWFDDTLVITLGNDQFDRNVESWIDDQYMDEEVEVLNTPCPNCKEWPGNGA